MNITQISFKSIENSGSKQHLRPKNNSYITPDTKEQDVFESSTKQQIPKRKNNLLAIYESFMGGIYNVVKLISSKKLESEQKRLTQQIKETEKAYDEQIRNLTTTEKIDYFERILFSTGFFILSEVECSILLEKFEKYGLDLNLFSKGKKQFFRSDDNINFFNIVCGRPSDNLTKKYIETFNKYIKIKPEEVSEEMINSIKFPCDAENVRQAIEQIKDKNLKSQMLDCFSRRMQELNSTKQSQLEQKFLKLAEKYLYPMPKVTNEQRDAISKKFGFDTSCVAQNFENPLSKTEIMHLAMKARKNEKMYEYCKENLDYLVLLTNSGSIIQDPFLDTKTFIMIVETAKEFLNGDTNGNDKDAVIQYTKGQETINGVLRFFPKVDEIVDDLVKNGMSKKTLAEVYELSRILHKIYSLHGNDIENNIITRDLLWDKMNEIIQALENKTIDTNALIQQLQNLKSLVQSKYNGSKTEVDINCLNKLTNAKVPKNSKLQFVRFEEADVLGQISLKRKPLSELMMDKTKTNIVLDFLNNEKPTILQPAYTSTSVYPYTVDIFNCRKIEWILKADENAKGCYIADINGMFNYNRKPTDKKTEAEFLFAPNSTIKIEKAEYDDNIGYGNTQYKIYGTISHVE